MGTFKGTKFFTPLTLALSQMGEGTAPVMSQRLFRENDQSRYDLIKDPSKRCGEGTFVSYNRWPPSVAHDNCEAAQPPDRADDKEEAMDFGIIFLSHVESYVE